MITSLERRFVVALRLLSCPCLIQTPRHLELNNMQFNQKMMMNFAVIAVIMSVMIMGTNQHTIKLDVSQRCCTRVSTTEIASPITGFSLQKRNGSCVNAVIFYTAEGMWCSHWKESWVKQKVQELKKLQRQMITSTVSTSLMKITSTVSTPLMKITSTVSKPLMKITSTASTPMMKTSSKSLDIAAFCRQCKSFVLENCYDYTRTMKKTFNPDLPMACYILFQLDKCIESSASRFYKENVLMCFISFP
ncbi:uncharacterized protein [Misgurnus anguillicaudatus]|uniref:uncharacterized protein isoform X2 n=1 Tax=Misgurnus anguillicaudatus TaxID=75329 RepID=UPI003CCFBF2C